MSAELLQDNEDSDFVRGRANQLVPPKEETTICDCINNGLIANLYLRGPKSEEITALLPGRPAEVALYEYRGIVVLLLDFGGVIMTECPVHFRQGELPEEHPKTPGISVVLTDLDTNIIQAVRFLSLRPSFWKELRTLLERQDQMKYTVTKQKLLEDFAMELPDDKWEKAVIRHKII